jgi:nicotinamide-nucleotide amidase
VTAELLLATLRASGLTLATAESCTGGLVAAALTDVAGASDVFERGYVTYSNRAKTDLLGVAPLLLQTHGAVSEAVARAMAEGALKQAGVDVAIAITGVAGPAGGTSEKPVQRHSFCRRAGRASTGSPRPMKGQSPRFKRCHDFVHGHVHGSAQCHLQQHGAHGVVDGYIHITGLARRRNGPHR